ncbi:MAG: TonB-dependent receptor [Gammaproteobacteria bacterium]|nr:TonB-dependent receptor [Gammaproteobacteria bacterium]
MGSPANPLVRAIRCASLVSILGVTAAAVAQETLEEIIVTATKRGEVSVQDISGGISAYSGEVIEQYNAYSLDDYARLQPSLQFASQGTGDAQLIIRGIQSPGSGTVGLYFDETVITASNFQDGGGRTPDLRLHDVQRLEVLKGPQGTLFGASSMSGTVRIITNKPDASAFDANVTVGGNTVEDGDEGYDVNGMINIPLIKDQLALRGVGWREERGGFIDQLSGLNGTFENDDVNDAEITGGRLMLKWTPGDYFAATAYAQIQDIEVDGTQAFYPQASGTLVPIPFNFDENVFFGPFGGEFGDLKLTKPSTEPWEDEIEMFGVTFELNLDKVETLATLNYFEREVFSPFDTTPTAIFFGLPQVPIAGHQDQYRSILSTELRVSSKFDGPFNFVVGFFYEDDDNFNTLDVLARAADGSILCKSRRKCLEDPALIPNIVFGRTLENDVEFQRYFGHVDYQLTEHWSVGGGVANFDGDLRNIEFLTQGLPDNDPPIFPPIIGGPPQLIPIPGVNERAESNELTYDANLSFKRNDEELYYFRAATGFRPGGINDTALGSQFGIDIPDTFDPDSVLSVEVGAKTSWFDNRLILNAAYFHMFWDDIFVPGEEPTGAFEFIANAAEAGIDGVELEIFARPSDPWLLTFGLTWLDAELTADQIFPPGFVPAPDTPRGFDGDPIPKVPDVALSGSVQYTVPANLFGSVQPVLRANFSYTDDSKTFFNDTDPFNASIGDYFLLNLNASFYWENWEAKLFINNVADDLGIVDADVGLDGFDAFPTFPRTFGAQLNWHY